MGHPSVYPTGVTLHDPSRAWGGYTLFQAALRGALLIDMSGREVQLWKDLQGFPNKLLPGGQLLSSGRRAGDCAEQRRGLLRDRQHRPRAGRCMNVPRARVASGCEFARERLP